jgi:glutathione S-transferase
MDTSAQPATIIGGPVSPYVRKVLAVCEMKGIAYRLDPIVPFFGDDRFTDVSPLRRIPVFIDDQVSLCDSSVICEYLEERYPSPAVLPRTAAQRAKARWVEEFADTRFGDVVVWKIFYHAVVLPFVFGKERETDKIRRAVAEDLPQVMDYLEGLAPAGGFLFEQLGIADISVAAFSCNLRWARSAPDASRWPKACSWFERTLAVPAVAKVTRYGDALMRTPPAEQRKALADLGVALTETTLATAKPRRGPMTTV